MYAKKTNDTVFIEHLLKDVFWEFMDLEKSFDTVDRHGMWLML